MDTTATGRRAVFNQLQIFAGLITRALAVLLANVARTILPFWIGSAAAFSLLAAWLSLPSTSAAAPEFARTLDLQLVFAIYIVLGVAAGTLPAIAVGVERSLGDLERLLEERVGRVIEEFVALPAEMGSVPADGVGSSMLEALEPLREHAGRVTRYIPPARALTRWLSNRVERELHLQLAVDLAAALHASRSMDAAPTPELLRLRGRVVQAIGTDMRRRVRWGRAIAIAAWAILFLLAALPPILLR